jgi:NADH-quinone oxidoreductase subunit J
MEIAFYIAGAVAVIATALTITRLNAVHALLYLVVSLLAVAIVFYTLGAPFVAALEVIVYAGAIMVLFIFVAMMLNLGERAAAQERQWLDGGIWIGPAVLALVLTVELVYLLAQGTSTGLAAAAVGPKQVGITLFGPYLIGVELASMLLLAGLVGAYHLGWRSPSYEEEEAQHAESGAGRPDAGGDLVRDGADRTAGTP